MALVGEAEVIATLNTEEVDAKIASLEGEGDLAGLGGLGAGAAVEGEAAGKDLREGVESETSQLAPDLAEDGALAGAGLSSGITKETGTLAEDVGDDAEDAGDALEKGIGGHLEGVRGMLQGLGVPASLLSGYALTAEAIGGAAAAAVDFGYKMQEADTDIASTEGISVKAATNIGNAFLDTAGKSEYSGHEMAEAFAPVSGLLKELQGHALSTKQSLEFLNESMTLARATGDSLSDSTSTLAGIMQALDVPLKGAAGASNILFNAANATGLSVDALANSAEKVKAKLGGLTPPIKDFGSLLVDLTNHGETGRAAMSALSTGFTTFLKPAADAATAQANLKIATDALPPSLKGLAEASITNAAASTKLYNDTENMSVANQNLVSQFQSAASAAQTAGDAQQKLGVNVLNAHGQLLPMSEIISELHDKLKGLSPAMATAKLDAMGFGSSAARWTGIIEAGPAALDKATKAVTKSNEVNKAAAIQSDTLKGRFDLLKATVEDFATQIGERLVPVVTDLEKAGVTLIPVLADGLKIGFTVVADAIDGTIRVVSDVVEWFKKGSVAALAVGAVLTTAVAPAFLGLARIALSSFDEMASGMVESAAGMAGTAYGTVLNWSKAGLGIQTSSEETADVITASNNSAMFSLNALGDAAVTTGDVVEGVAPEVEAAEEGMSGGLGLVLIAATLLATHWKLVWGILKDTAEDTWHFIDNDVIHPIETAFKDVVDFIKSHWELLVGIIGGPLVIAAELIYHFRGDIEDAFKDIIGDMEKIGEDIVKGLVNGIKDAGHLAADAAKDVAHSVEDGVKDVLHIFSPSQAFHEIGGNIVQGLADGIKDHSAIAEQAARTMSGKVRDAASGKGSGGLGGSGGGSINLTMVKGAIDIHVSGMDEKKIEEIVEKGLVDGFRYLNRELAAGVSQLSAKASA